VDRLDQLIARSEREIEAHAGRLGRSETGKYFIAEATKLLAGLRFWSQENYRSDHVVREVLEAGDVTVLNAIAGELMAMSNLDGQFAGRLLATIAGRPSEELPAITDYALRAL